MSYNENDDLAGGSDEFEGGEKEPNIDELDLMDDPDLDDGFRFGSEEEEEAY